LAEKPVRAAIYARISRDKEGLALGVERQVEDCEAQAQRLGWTFNPDARHVFWDNDISASSKSKKRRPDFEALLAGVLSGEYDGVIYYSTSRFTRRPMEFERIIELVKETGVRLASCTAGIADLTTADGRMIARVLAAQDAREAETISERVSRQQRQRREAGKPHATGMRPFGYGWTDEDGKHFGHLDVNAAEADEVRRAVKMTLDGATLGDIMRDFNERGVRPVIGDRWGRVSVRRLLLRPRNYGLVEHNERDSHGKIVRTTLSVGEFEALVDGGEAMLDRIKAAVSARDSIGKTRYAGREHLLSGFVFCGVCGHRMKVSARRDARGEVRADSFVSCLKDLGGCGKVKRNLLLLEAFVFEVVEAKLATVRAFDPDEDETADGREFARLVAEKETVEKKMSDLKAQYDADKDFEAVDFVPMNNNFRKKLREIEAQMREFEQGASLGDLGDVLQTWQAGGFEERREILEALEPQVVLHPIGKVGPVRSRMMVPDTTSVDFLAA
jgi:site-specific DNA recombinase